MARARYNVESSGGRVVSAHARMAAAQVAAARAARKSARRGNGLTFCVVERLTGLKKKCFREHGRRLRRLRRQGLIY